MFRPRCNTSSRTDRPVGVTYRVAGSIAEVLAPLAQLAEQRTLNPRVRGSSPWRRTRPDLVFLPSPAPSERPLGAGGCSMAARLHGSCTRGAGDKRCGCGHRCPGTAGDTGDVTL